MLLKKQKTCVLTELIGQAIFQTLLMKGGCCLLVILSLCFTYFASELNQILRGVILEEAAP